MTTNRTATTTTALTAPVEPVAATGGRRTRSKGQLTLLATTGPWRLDERTRRVGRQGVAEARAQLQAARQRDLDRRGHDTRAA